MKARTRLALVGNPTAGAGRTSHQIRDAAAALRDLGADPVIVTAASASAMRDRLAALIDERITRVVVVGGDGTINVAIQVLAQRDVTVGIIPSGSGNDFANSLSIPTDTAAAAACALGEGSPVDLIRIGERWAATVATLGFSGQVTARANTMRWPRASSRYAIATVLETRRVKALQLGLRADSCSFDERATLVAVANTSIFGGGMKIAPMARVDDGKLEVIVVKPMAGLQILRVLRQAFNGTHIALDTVEHTTASAVSLQCPGEQLWADGEPCGDVLGPDPIHLDAVPGALRVARGPIRNPS